MRPWTEPRPPPYPRSYRDRTAAVPAAVPAAASLAVAATAAAAAAAARPLALHVLHDQLRAEEVGAVLRLQRALGVVQLRELDEREVLARGDLRPHQLPVRGNTGSRSEPLVLA